MMAICCARLRSISLLSMSRQVATTMTRAISLSPLPSSPSHGPRSTSNLPPLPAALAPLPGVRNPSPRTKRATTVRTSSWSRFPLPLSAADGATATRTTRSRTSMLATSASSLLPPCPADADSEGEDEDNSSRAKARRSPRPAYRHWKVPRRERNPTARVSSPSEVTANVSHGSSLSSSLASLSSSSLEEEGKRMRRTVAGSGPGPRAGEKRRTTGGRPGPKR
ncbi:hypothetical protein VTG60DRAFT_1815 [Thermothelomyces hinnuleus]